MLGCDWHTVNASVRRWGQALLDADADRIAPVVALGLDETLFCRRGRFAQRAWRTSIVDVALGQLLDVVPRRTADGPARWLLRRPQNWLAAVRWAVLDLSGPYRAAYDAAVPDAKQVADPFHVVRLANTALDEVRRRVQNPTLGHRGHTHDPLYRARKLLVAAHERVAFGFTNFANYRIRALLYAGNPTGPSSTNSLPPEIRRARYRWEVSRGCSSQGPDHRPVLGPAPTTVFNGSGESRALGDRRIQPTDWRHPAPAGRDGYSDHEALRLDGYVRNWGRTFVG